VAESAAAHDAERKEAKVDIHPAETFFSFGEIGDIVPSRRSDEGSISHGALHQTR
jgi:hypothetical protein